MSGVEVCVHVMAHGEGLELPDYATVGSAGVDLRAAVPEGAPVTLKHGKREIIPTGLRLVLPKDYEAQIRPRSGLAVKNGVTVLNTPGTIDSDYRGEVKIALINLGKETFTVERGMRIAQMVIQPVTRVTFSQISELDLDETERGAGGFGSTGTGR
ncbi:MAG: dUTP diphosphatase [Rhodospirillales bacterium]